MCGMGVDLAERDAIAVLEPVLLGLNHCHHTALGLRHTGNVRLAQLLA